MAVSITSPKIEELLKWDMIEVVNSKLDSGESPAQIAKWINKNGFKISAPMVYQYRDVRRQAIIEGLQVENFFTPAIISKSAKNFSLSSSKDRVKSELDVLDVIIQRGYQTIKEFDDRPIPPSLLMRAIELKNKLTEGSHNNMTAYGIDYLKQMEQAKFQAILSVVLEFIPEERREEAITAIDKAEDEFYRGTEYYEEYLKAKGTQDENIVDLEDEDLME